MRKIGMVASAAALALTLTVVGTAANAATVSGSHSCNSGLYVAATGQQTSGDYKLTIKIGGVVVREGYGYYKLTGYSNRSGSSWSAESAALVAAGSYAFCAPQMQSGER